MQPAVLQLQLFLEWFWLDCLLDDGRTCAGRLLARDVSRLTPAARRALRAAASARLTCVRVEAVDPGERVWVSDVIEPTVPFSVHDAELTLFVQPAAGLVGRFGEIDGISRVLGTIYPLPADDADAVAELFRERRPSLLAETADGGAALYRMLEAAALVRFAAATGDDEEDPGPGGGLVTMA